MDVEGARAWVGPAGMDQPAITIELLRNGTAIDSADFEANATDYSYSFLGLPKYAADWAVHLHDWEPAVGFTSAVEGYNVTNPTTSRKRWTWKARRRGSARRT